VKYTLCVTQQCNLACSYCYVGKRQAQMSIPIASSIIDFAIQNTPPSEKIYFGIFGGEPLLEFNRVKEIVRMIELHPQYNRSQVKIEMVTNGTIFSSEIAEFLREHSINLCISCDGPAGVHDVFRKTPKGDSSFPKVESTILRALKSLSVVMVNAVYHPKTFRELPKVVEYFITLGFSTIHLNPDFSASWSDNEIAVLPQIYDEIADIFINQHLNGKVIFIDFINFKIAAIVRGGYREHERCRMGKGEFAFTPEGDVYPCERLIGRGREDGHCIGNIATGIELESMACHRMSGAEVNSECLSCSLKKYCMNWCGCSNFMASGYYNRVSPFTCASERGAIKAAYKAFTTLEEKLGPTFYDHLICDG
jgi:uncharacterized protein